MGRVSVVTDSTSDIPADLARELGITVVPLRVHFGQETYLDYVEMSPEEFFHKLASSPHHPKTSQPAPGEFANVYRELGQKGNEVLSIHISSHLSGTIQSATMARDLVPEVRVEVVDSRSASVGAAFCVIQAAKAAKDGQDMETCARVARETLEKVSIYFAVDTLEYLHRNGRIGRAQHLLGSLLSVKPILTISDGMVAPFDRVRGRGKVVPRLLEIAREKLPPGGEVLLGVVHGNAPGPAGEIVKDLKMYYSTSDVLMGSVGPVIGTHSGPGVLGLGVCPVVRW
ncbi:MAG: DegV family protein [Bacillota bacterium]